MGTLWQWHGHGSPLTLLVLTLAFGLGVTLLALWIALPFAVFGVKSALRDLLVAQRETNRLLAGLGRPPELPPAAGPPRDQESAVSHAQISQMSQME
ncbi:MAG: hypothetical protein HZB55_14555 [Deltaproteobacteria bacterium]|nr:hypothetical protein [Deltaproteobacteria bacterium]